MMHRPFNKTVNMGNAMTVRSYGKAGSHPLTAANYAILGGLLVLWLALGAYYWLLVMAWLYKSAVKEGMNKSLWPILGLFTNLLAVLLFLIVRDDPRRAKAAQA